jgi:hypothetical protein
MGWASFPIYFGGFLFFLVPPLSFSTGCGAFSIPLLLALPLQLAT